MIRRIAAAAFAACLSVAAVAPAAASATGGDNTAIAVNTKDGSSVFKIAFSIKRVMDGTVDQQNAAVAYASCEECTTVAIAVQVVLVMGEVDTVTPTNVAIAINDQCTTCQTMAQAFQYVYGTSEGFKFTKESWARLRALRKRLRDLKKSGLALDAIAAEVKSITAELDQLLKDELSAADPVLVADPPMEESDTSTTTTTEPETTTTTESTTSTTGAP